MEQQDKKTVGQFLREAREAIGMSREEVAEATSIRPVFLTAMEEDDYRLLPDERYILRFLDEYATFLGLDPDRVQRRFLQQIARRRDSLVVFPPKRTIRLSFRQILPIILLLLFLVPAVFIGLSLLANRPGEPERTVPAEPVVAEPPPTPLATATEALAPDPVSKAAPAVPVPPVSEPAPVVPAPPVPSDVPGFRYTLRARAMETTWMLVTIDGQDTRDVLLRAGETWQWRARRGFLVTVGNGSGVELILNGRPLPPLGEPGEVVRDLRLPRQAATDLQPSAAD